MGRNYRSISALAFLAILVSTNTTFAQNLSTNQTLLESAFRYAQCRTNFTTTYIGQIIAAAPSLAPLNQYSTTLQADTARIPSLATSGNVTAFKNYISGTYDPELNVIAKNVSSQLRTANLSANVIAELRRNYNSTLANYKSCNMESAKEYALQKLNMFNSSIRSYQNQANNMASKGLNASSLYQMLQNAQTQIVNPFAIAINQATNTSQTYAAINAYCLFDGCKNGTNFHLAAHFSLQSLTIQLNYFETDKNISSSSLAPASLDLNNASSILQIVGTKAYVGNQADNIFDNLTAASKAMQQARKQDSFARLKQNAEREISEYQNIISKYQASISKLPEGTNTTQLNSTLSQAETQIIEPLQAALNASTNATQLYKAFQSYCLENSCKNGTNFHLSVKLKLDQSQAYLEYLELKANASTYVIVNQTALSAAEGYLSSASALINSVGQAQFTLIQTSQLAAYFSNFTAALRNAFTVSRSKLNAVNSASINKAHNKYPTTEVNTITGVKGEANAAIANALRHTTTTTISREGNGAASTAGTNTPKGISTNADGNGLTAS
jgi:flagellar biosynthesis chaperone FliJ